MSAAEVGPITTPEQITPRAEVLQYLDIMRTSAQRGWVEDGNVAILNMIAQVEPALHSSMRPVAPSRS